MEPHYLWQKMIEQAIKESKKKAIMLRQMNGYPRKLWDYLTVYAAEFWSMAVFPNYQLKGSTLNLDLTGFTKTSYHICSFSGTTLAGIWILDISQEIRGN